MIFLADLQFIVQQKHFKRGNMKLKCLATIATVYTTNNEKSYEGERQIKGVMLASKETTTLSGSRADSMHSTGKFHKNLIRSSKMLDWNYNFFKLHSLLLFHLKINYD